MPMHLPTTTSSSLLEQRTPRDVAGGYLLLMLSKGNGDDNKNTAAAAAAQQQQAIERLKQKERELAEKIRQRKQIELYLAATSAAVLPSSSFSLFSRTGANMNTPSHQNNGYPPAMLVPSNSSISTQRFDLSQPYLFNQLAAATTDRTNSSLLFSTHTPPLVHRVAPDELHGNESDDDEEEDEHSEADQEHHHDEQMKAALGDAAASRRQLLRPFASTTNVLDNDHYDDDDEQDHSSSGGEQQRVRVCSPAPPSPPGSPSYSSTSSSTSSSRRMLLERHQHEDLEHASSLLPSLVIPTSNKIPLPQWFKKSKTTVVIGKGHLPRKTPGNILLRQMVRDRLEDYQQRNRRGRADIVSEIYSSIQDLNPNCRYFGNFSPEGVWCEAKEHSARDKIAATFRDCLSHLYKSSTKSKVAKRRIRKAETKHNARSGGSKKKQKQQSAAGS